MARAFSALIVEGTHGVGKSTLIDALIRRHVSRSPQRKIRSLIHLAQSHTYGPLAPAEDAGTLMVEENARHLDTVVTMLEWLASSVRHKEAPACFVLIDTLHVTHCVRPGRVAWLDVAPFDARLGAIGAKLLFLNASDETIRRRAIDAAAGTQFLTQYARKFGQTPDELQAYFVREQAALEQFARQSSMETLFLSAEADVESLSEAAYSFFLDA